MKSDFEWDEKKNQSNVEKHGISFEEAQFTFKDRRRLLLEDIDHSTKKEPRYFCIGKIKKGICTVRFTYRNKKIRIIGAGIWRKERSIYEKQTTNR